MNITITFETNGGSEISSLFFTNEISIGIPSQPVKDGHTFDNWYANPELTTIFLFDTVISEDITLYAKWNVNSYTITYLDHDGSDILTTSVEYGADLSNNSSPTPVREGFVFDSWDIELPSIMPSNNLTLNALYRLPYNTITLDPMGGLETESIEVDHDQKTIIPKGQTNQTNQMFAGWYTDQSYETLFNSSFLIEQDLTLYAKWNKVDTNGTYQLATCDHNGINPYSIDACELSILVTDTLYESDYDWEKARQILIDEGFVNVPESIGFYEWYNAGKSASEIPSGLFTRMTTSKPDLQDQEGKVWRITLREDLEFVDGTTIDANTFDYSWRMLLDPNFENPYAVFLTMFIPLVNAENYLKQDLTNELALIDWDEVGFKVISQYVFELTLTEGLTQIDLMNLFTNVNTGIVHQVQYEAGMNTERTQTTYGQITNPLISYGPYIMSEWSEGEYFHYVLNQNHYAVSDYLISNIQYNIYPNINDFYTLNADFNDGFLDSIPIISNLIYDTNESQMKMSPNTTFFRLSFNIQDTTNPMLAQATFRKALFLAIDRDTYTTEVKSPGIPTLGFLGPVYASSIFNDYTYRASSQGQDVLSDYSPETNGYDPIRAKALFDEAYDAAVLDGYIEDGDIVSVEFKYYYAQTGYDPQTWFKNTVEAVFNTGETSPIFEFVLVPLSSSALYMDESLGNYEILYKGWQSLRFDAPGLLGQAYNSESYLMAEKGFDTGNAIITVSLPNTKVALENWVVDYLLISSPTESQISSYDAWVSLLDQFDGDQLTVTFDELYHIAYNQLYNVPNRYYLGIDIDLDSITAALESVLIDQMISIPLYTRVNYTAYSNRVLIQADEFHHVMDWGGFKYMYLLDLEQTKY